MEKKASYKKSDKGITVIALTITIIVLLILAGVSLNLVAGSNGIMGKAVKSVTVTKEAQKEEEIHLKLAEIMMDYYVEGRGQTLQEYIIEKCKENEGDILNVGNGMFSTIDGDLYYTDAEGNTSVIEIDSNGNVTIEGSVSVDGSIKDEKAPAISVTTTTNLITFVARDIISGVAGWNYSETNEEPTTWNEVSPSQKSFSYTIENLTNNTTYYIWAKDANGNISQGKEVRTRDFDELDYEISWEEAMATITVKSPSVGVQFKTSQEGSWENYSASNQPRVASGTTVYFQVTDGTNTKAFETVKPLKTSTITYDANGGEGNMPNIQTATHTENVIVDTTSSLMKTGYHFLGWALTSNATSAITSFEMPAQDVTLYAVWQVHNFSTNTGVCTICNSNENYLDTENERKMSNWNFSKYREKDTLFLWDADDYWKPSQQGPWLNISHWADPAGYNVLGGNTGAIVYYSKIDVTNMSKIVMNAVLKTNYDSATNITKIGLCNSNENIQYTDYSNFLISTEQKSLGTTAKECKMVLDVSSYTGSYYLKITVIHDLPTSAFFTSCTIINSLYPIYK